MSTDRRREDAEMSFTARISADGRIEVPVEASGWLRAHSGSAVVVRVAEQRFAAALKSRGISDEEVDRIAAVQLERRETAARFLLAEGALRSRPKARAGR